MDYIVAGLRSRLVRGKVSLDKPPVLGSIIQVAGHGWRVVSIKDGLLLVTLPMGTEDGVDKRYVHATKLPSGEGR